MDINELNLKAKEYFEDNKDRFKDSMIIFREFIDLYPFREHPEKIGLLEPDDIYNPGNKSFLYFIEHGLPDFGRLKVGGDEYSKNAKNNISKFKELLKIAIDDSLSIFEKVDAPWNEIKRFGGDRMVAKKIIFCYNPEKILPIYKTEHLEYYATQIDKNFRNKPNKFHKPYDKFSSGQKFEYLNDIILKFKKDIVKTEMDNSMFMHFLYEMDPLSKINNHEVKDALEKIKNGPSELKIRYFIEKTLKNHDSNKQEDIDEIRYLFQKGIPKYLENIANGSLEGDIKRYKVEGVPGTRQKNSQDEFGYLPQIYVFDEITKQKDKFKEYNYYILYILREDRKGIYLSLNHGQGYMKEMMKEWGEWRNWFKDKHLENNLKVRIREIRNQLGEIGIFSDIMDLGSKYATSSSIFESASICSKYYTLEDLPAEEELILDFKEILKVYNNIIDVNIDEEEEKGIPKSFIEYLNEKGFYFKPELVENFLLSLKVKPFVILTGNSGTGKTKLAQLFANYISKSHTKKSFKSEVMVGQSASSGGWTLSKSEFLDFYPALKKYEEEYDIVLDTIKTRGNLNIWPQLFYEKKDSKIKKMLNDYAKKDPKTRINLEIILNKKESSQYKIIPVGANWTENRQIIGFHNVIMGNYQETPALELILESSKPNNLELPHFLILDEMNLSHVERYFSDFLSAMESQEPIPLHSNDKLKEVPNEITFSDNLFVIGTVNVDETTYMFSPKVLDRSNTIEFLTPSAKGYMDGEKISNSINGNINYLENPLSDINIRKAQISELKELMGAIITNNGIFWDLISIELENFQKILKKAGFDFGFRVINEIMRFMYVAWKYEGSNQNWNNWQRYFDAQIKQKMLPRIHGSQRTLENTLNELSTLCDDYPTSRIKLEEMKDILYKQRFVSFTN